LCDKDALRAEGQVQQRVLLDLLLASAGVDTAAWVNSALS
jgi:hypothetical protein